MFYNIDFIRHGDAIGSDDRTRVLSPTGQAQATLFGHTRYKYGETYATVITSGVQRTTETVRGIMEEMRNHIYRFHVVSDMFDPEELDEYAKARQETYKELRGASLAQYRSRCPEAMIDIGHRSLMSIQDILRKRTFIGNVLIVGHQVYTNEIVAQYWSSGDEIHGSGATERLIHGPGIGGCEGYRLMVDDENRPLDLTPLSLPEISKS